MTVTGFVDDLRPFFWSATVVGRTTRVRDWHSEQGARGDGLRRAGRGLAERRAKASARPRGRPPRRCRGDERLAAHVVDAASNSSLRDESWRRPEDGT